MALVKVPLRKNAKEVHENIKDKRQSSEPQFKVREIVGTSDLIWTFSIVDLTNRSNTLYPITEIISDTLPIYHKTNLHERYNEVSQYTST